MLIRVEAMSVRVGHPVCRSHTAAPPLTRTACSIEQRWSAIQPHPPARLYPHLTASRRCTACHCLTRHPLLLRATSHCNALNQPSLSRPTLHTTPLHYTLLLAIMEQATCFEPRSPYFDAPLSPPLFFPSDAQHDLDPFSFDDTRLSSPGLLTPSSTTDSNESIDFPPPYVPDTAYIAPEHPLTASTQPSSAYHEQSASVSPDSSALPDDFTVTPTSTSWPPSPFALPDPTSLSLTMYTHPPRPAPTGPVELVFPLPPVTKPKRNRTNLSHLSNNERLQHKRARHRQIDATRREREKAAIRRLRLLVEEMTGAGDKVAGEAAAAEIEEREREKEDDGEGSLGNKTDVLEQGITLIEQLRDLCSTLQSDNGKPPAVTFTRWPKSGSFTIPRGSPAILSLLPSPTSSIIAHLDRSQTLRASTSVTSPICSLMVLFPGALVMDVSRSFVEFSGYNDSQLLQSHLNPWYLPPSSKHHTICPLLVDGRDERSGRVTKLVGQYGASKADMGELIRGERGRLDVDWRYRLADGRLMETKTTGWMEDKDLSEEVTIEFTDETGAKHIWTSYRTLIRMVFARQDAVEIDNDETRSFKPPTWTTKEVRNGRRTQVFIQHVSTE